MTGWATDPK